MTTIAILDANVLIPNALCDFLLRLAEEDLYRPRWSGAILDEVRRHVPVAPSAIERRIAFMNAAFDDALVVGYEPLIGQMGNDPKDRHGGARLTTHQVLDYLASAGARRFATVVRPYIPPASAEIAPATP